MYILALRHPTKSKHILAIKSKKNKVVPIFFCEDDARRLHGLLEADDSFKELSILHTDSKLIDNLENNNVSYTILDSEDCEIPTLERSYCFIA